MVKICLKCKRKLSLSNFNWKIKNVRRATYCKKCSREYIKNHYKKNRDYYLEKARKRNRKVRQKAHAYVVSYLKAHSCTDCGEKDILVLEFDHRDKTKKKNSISRIIGGAEPLKRLITEISKCDVRCANCHRRKTAKENNVWKLTQAPVA